MQLMVRHPRAGGFSLIEVLVAMVVLAVGLLGIAKLEAAAFSNTAIAARRSLAALEADSLAASMHVNRGYWTNADPSGATITASGTTVTVAAGGGGQLSTALAANPACAANTAAGAGGGACPLVQNVAAYDLIQWATALQSMLPNYTASVACGTVTPVTCTITITWSENAVAVNSQEASIQASIASAGASAAEAFENPSYTLYVQP